MRPLLYISTALVVMGLAFWAYRENYETQNALREVRKLQNEISDLREALALQRAEWAYLNRPERLRDLAALNFDSLGLLPMEPEQFGDVDSVTYPRAPIPGLDGAVDVIGDLPEDPL